MPSITLHPPSATRNPNPNPLPNLIQTPSGLAIIELQGTIHFPEPELDASEPDRKRKRVDDAFSVSAARAQETLVGKLVFPLYDPTVGAEGGTWMKRVHFYVGSHQRMTGEVKKLGKPLAVIRKRRWGQGERQGGDGGVVSQEPGTGATTEEDQEELEIVEIVKYKIVFASRPEPVGASEGDGGS
ncbi:hypothetical protein CAC42_4735 [Sphaceloma murrayae]|uniref:Chromosome transmission fidelity protein 8 n=1 Tax=Sphaceloma murrayae TaxID=2082308 RepID=A0A2K1QP34_9PEZI|nr:hypothetical protein CAC42_4735 [Sphaceloma murrayae]